MFFSRRDALVDHLLHKIRMLTARQRKIKEGLNDECQCKVGSICSEQGHLRAKRHLLFSPPTWSFRFIIHHLDKLCLILHLYVLLHHSTPPSIGWGGKRKRGAGELLSWQGLFFFTDPFLISVPALLFLSGATRDQEGVEHRKRCGGTPDKASV